jgi:predicted amidohydrolase
VKIAVVQHALRPAPAQDLEALVLASARAAARGAETVFLPNVSAVHDGPLADDLFRRTSDDAPNAVVVVAHADGGSGGLPEAAEALGKVCVLVGDDAIDPEVLQDCAAGRPGLVVLAPGAESDLQAQAVLEQAVALSTSLASVILVVETDGAELGEPGHGGSAIVHLGEVLAEAGPGDDVLIADVAVPLGPPEAPEAMPDLPPLLKQRLGAHRGRKLEVGYPADLD